MNVDEVVLSDTAKSKCFRMINQDRLKEIVRSQNPHRKLAEGKYLFKSDFENKNGNREKVDIVVSKEDEGDKEIGLVITQKHREHKIPF